MNILNFLEDLIKKKWKVENIYVPFSFFYKSIETYIKGKYKKNIKKDIYFINWKENLYVWVKYEDEKDVFYITGVNNKNDNQLYNKKILLRNLSIDNEFIKEIRKNIKKELNFDLDNPYQRGRFLLYLRKKVKESFLLFLKKTQNKILKQIKKTKEVNVSDESRIISASDLNYLKDKDENKKQYYYD